MSNLVSFSLQLSVHPTCDNTSVTVIASLQCLRAPFKRFNLLSLRSRIVGILLGTV